jgi:hypothetical protein
MVDRKEVSLTRREAIRSAMAALTLAAPATALVVGQAQAYDPQGDEKRARYRETDHVKAFYRTNGYETLMK